MIAGKLNTHTVIYSDASCLSFHLPGCCDLLKEVLQRRDIAGVYRSEKDLRIRTHTHTHNVVILYSGVCLTFSSSSPSACTHARTHTPTQWYTHTQFQVHVCCCTLDVLHSQCAQIILAYNFLLPVSDSATSCLLSRMVQKGQEQWSQSFCTQTPGTRPIRLN